MKKKLVLLMILLLTVSAGSGCASLNIGSTSDSSQEAREAEENSENTADTEETSQSVSAEEQTDEDMFTDRDYEEDYQEEDCVSVTLSGTTPSSGSDSVEISEGTITITEEGTYLISGTLSDGMIIVNAPDTAKVRLIFEGVEINSETSAPLYILEADKVFLTLAEESENTLSNSGTYTAIDDSNIDSVIYSKQDLTLNGTGTLTISSPGGHGIVSNDDLAITDGTYNITAASHGLKANDSIRITGGSQLTVTAGKDGIHAENDEDPSLGFVYISDGTIAVEAEGDGISAGSYMQIAAGTFQIQAGGGSENGTKESSDSWGEFRGGGGPGGGSPAGKGQGGEGQAPGRTGGRSESGEAGSSEIASPAKPSVSVENLSAESLSTESSTTESSTAENSDPAEDSSADGSKSTEEESSTSMKGVKAAGDLLISGGSFTIDSADDSIHSNSSITIKDGVFEIASGDDAVHADENLTVAAGTMNISESYEGLEALHLEIQGGDITLTASDDGLNAAGGTDSSGTQGGRDGMFGGGGPGSSSSDGTILITGGTLNITASGDGIDANGSLEITGGYTVVAGPTQGDTSTLDYDTTARITGGTFIGTGASGMAQTFSDAQQGVISVSVGEQSAGTEVTLTDSSGNVVLDVTPDLSFAVVILSSPDLVFGESYTLTVGTASEKVEAG